MQRAMNHGLNIKPINLCVKLIIMQRIQDHLPKKALTSQSIYVSERAEWDWLFTRPRLLSAAERGLLWTVQLPWGRSVWLVASFTCSIVLPPIAERERERRGPQSFRQSWSWYATNGMEVNSPHLSKEGKKKYKEIMKVCLCHEVKTKRG